MDDRDDDAPFLPFPIYDVSNEEWCPGPPSPAQMRAGEVLTREVEWRARKLGLSRRQLLRSAAGTATAFWAVNVAYGLPTEGGDAPLPVSREETLDAAAAGERLARQYFVMDVQLHHVDLSDPRFSEQQVAHLNSCFRFLPPKLRCTPEGLALLSQANLVKEVFLDSETDVGIISGVPSAIILGPKTMAATRDLVNEITGSRRCLSQAVCAPLMPPGSDRSIDTLEFQRRSLDAVAIKLYTYDGGWWLDDEKVSYPMLEEAARLGFKIINVHKGIPLGNDTYVATRDLPKVLRDWPQLTFVVYHSGYFHNRPGKEMDDFMATLAILGPAEKSHLYSEIGTSFALAFTRSPEKAAHLVGSLLKELGPRRILWGTDSIWWGTPQWQIDAFKALTIPESMQEEFGYPALTDEVKARILGLNAAELYGISVPEVAPVARADKVESLRAAQADGGVGRTYSVYGLRTRREFLQLKERERYLFGDG
jgi:uncharacterized protein